MLPKTIITASCDTKCVNATFAISNATKNDRQTDNKMLTFHPNIALNKPLQWHTHTRWYVGNKTENARPCYTKYQLSFIFSVHFHLRLFIVFGTLVFSTPSCYIQFYLVASIFALFVCTASTSSKLKSILHHSTNKCSIEHFELCVNY